MLSIPATSASSERLASAAGNVVTQDRNRLAPDKVELITFAKVNWKFSGKRLRKKKKEERRKRK
jgi:hypothetical protein